MTRFACLCLLLSSLSHSLLAVERTALVGGTLVDGTLSEPIRNSVILIEGARIVAVGSVGTLAVPADAEVVSTEGMTVLPGLWDMHVHLMINGHADYAHWDKTYPARFRDTIMPASAKQLLLAGVTGARDLGGAAGRQHRGARRDRQRPHPRTHAVRVGTFHPEEALSRHRAVPLGRGFAGRRARQGTAHRRSGAWTWSS